MDAAQLNTITDVEMLRGLVAEKIAEIVRREQMHADVLAQRDASLAARDALLAKRDREIVYKTAKIDQLTREIARLRRVQFAARSEKLDPEQRALFDEIVGADLAAAEAELDALRSPQATPARERAQPKRRPLPPELPRIETRHEPASCDCAECGAALVQIGEHVSEKLDCKPLEFFVQRDVYPQYACRACQTVVAEPVAPAIIDRGQAAPGLLAQVAIAKYVDHLPLYRQEAIYARSGIELGRSTLAEWIGAIGVALAPLTAALRAELLAQPVLHADETPVAQLDPGAGKTKRAYLWAYHSNHLAAGPPIVVFDYQASRSGRHASDFLLGWQGHLMVDDYAGYKTLFRSGITELACLAHARRKFFDLYTANQSTVAQEALARIGKLYAIEQAGRGLDAEARRALRQREAKPVLDALFTWLYATRQSLADGGATAKAIDYSLKRWQALIRYADSGDLPIDNNPMENAIRPIAIGKKNWLFAGSERAGKRAAAIQSLIGTARLNGLDPAAWLRETLEKLPAWPNSRIDELLPLRGAFNP